VREITMAQGLSARLDNEGNWFSSDQGFEKYLNGVMGLALAEVTVSQGDPVAVAFMRLVRKLSPNEVVDDNKIDFEPETLDVN